MNVSAFELIYTLESNMKNPDNPLPGVENVVFERKAHFNDKTAFLTVLNTNVHDPAQRVVGTVEVKTIPQAEDGTAHECIVQVPSLKINKKHFFLITDKLSRHLSMEKLKSSLSPGILASSDPIGV